MRSEKEMTAVMEQAGDEHEVAEEGSYESGFLAGVAQALGWAMSPYGGTRDIEAIVDRMEAKRKAEAEAAEG